MVLLSGSTLFANYDTSSYDAIVNMIARHRRLLDGHHRRVDGLRIHVLNCRVADLLPDLRLASSPQVSPQILGDMLCHP